jgi:hypothetical protein
MRSIAPPGGRNRSVAASSPGRAGDSWYYYSRSSCTAPFRVMPLAIPLPRSRRAAVLHTAHNQPSPRTPAVLTAAVLFCSCCCCFAPDAEQIASLLKDAGNVGSVGPAHQAAAVRQLRGALSVATAASKEEWLSRPHAELHRALGRALLASPGSSTMDGGRAQQSAAQQALAHFVAAARIQDTNAHPLTALESQGNEDDDDDDDQPAHSAAPAEPAGNRPPPPPCPTSISVCCFWLTLGGGAGCREAAGHIRAAGAAGARARVPRGGWADGARNDGHVRAWQLGRLWEAGMRCRGGGTLLPPAA